MDLPIKIFFDPFKKEILWKQKNSIQKIAVSAIIRIGREIRCLPYAGLLLRVLLSSIRSFMQ